jgi:hypothetical protein
MSDTEEEVVTVVTSDETTGSLPYDATVLVISKHHLEDHLMDGSDNVPDGVYEREPSNHGLVV